MLNSQHLNTFYILVEVQSFTQAAKKLGLTQPAVTQHIQKLERELGRQLVVRYGRHIELTQAGRSLYQYVLKTLKHYHEFKLTWQEVLADNSAA